MARVVIPIVTALPDSAVGIDLLASDVAADAANDHSLANASGRVVLVVNAPAATSVDVTIVSVADPYGRTGNLGPTAVDASSLHIFGPFTPRLFSQQSGADLGLTYINLDNLVGAVTLVGLQVP